MVKWSHILIFISYLSSVLIMHWIQWSLWPEIIFQNHMSMLLSYLYWIKHDSQTWWNTKLSQIFDTLKHWLTWNLRRIDKKSQHSNIFSSFELLINKKNIVHESFLTRALTNGKMNEVIGRTVYELSPSLIVSFDQVKFRNQ